MSAGHRNVPFHHAFVGAADAQCFRGAACFYRSTFAEHDIEEHESQKHRRGKEKVKQAAPPRSRYSELVSANAPTHPKVRRVEFQARLVCRIIDSCCSTASVSRKRTGDWLCSRHAVRSMSPCTGGMR